MPCSCHYLSLMLGLVLTCSTLGQEQGKRDGRQDAAAQRDSPLAELDAKIARSLEDEKWSTSSKRFVRGLWEEYKEAYLRGASPADRKRGLNVARDVLGTDENGIPVASNLPDADDYDTYLGRFDRDGRLFMEVVKANAGRFHVKLENHDIPAVPVGRTLVFTTGDVVYSHLPQFGEKPHATLELYQLVRLNGELYMAGVSEQITLDHRIQQPGQ